MIAPRVDVARYLLVLALVPTLAFAIATLDRATLALIVGVSLAYATAPWWLDRPEDR